MRRPKTLTALGLSLMVLVPACARAQRTAKPSVWAPLPPNPVYVTGDTWQAGGQTYRLYGVQSCLRGTYLTNAHGIKRDCGEISLAMLVNYVRALRPICASVATTPQTRTSFVYCLGTIQAGPNKGKRVDLGTALIRSGWDLASVNAQGQAFNMTYAVAEAYARQSKTGLWAFKGAPDPNHIIAGWLSKQSPSPPAGPPNPAQSRP